MLAQLPMSLQHMVMLEWLSPEEVMALGCASAELLQSVRASPQAFRAAKRTVVHERCIAWFQEQGVELRLWTEILFDSLIGERHMVNGVKHRDGDLPACTGRYGSQEWYQHGLCHRDGDLPACIWSGGTQLWYQHGKLHRDGDKPAHTEANGTQEWYQQGKLHRNGDKPAVILADGTQLWYQQGKRHRNGDKPAVIDANGTREWYQHGVPVLGNDEEEDKED